MASEHLLSGGFILLVLLWQLHNWVRAPSSAKRGDLIAILYIGGLLTVFTVSFIYAGVVGALIAAIVLTGGALLLVKVIQPEPSDTEEAVHTMATNDTMEVAEEINRRNKD